LHDTASESENVTAIVCKVAEKLGVRISEEDVAAAHKGAHKERKLSKDYRCGAEIKEDLRQNCGEKKKYSTE
jgi:hypothetical protein